MTSAAAEWPEARTLLVPDLKAHLTRHNIYFTPGTLRAGLVQIYNDNRPLSLRASTNAESDAHHRSRPPKRKLPNRPDQDNPPDHPPKRPRPTKTKPRVTNRWPAPSRLNIEQLQRILTEHQVTFGDAADRKTLVPLYEQLKDSRQTHSGTADKLPNEGGSGTTPVVPNTDPQPIPDPPPSQPASLPPPQPPLPPSPQPVFLPPPQPDLVPSPDNDVSRATVVVPKSNTGKTECSSHEDPTPTGLPQIDLAPPPSSKRPADETPIQDEALARMAQPDPSTHSQTQPDPSAARSPQPDPAAGVPKPDKVIPIVTLVVPKTNTGKAECSSHKDPTPTGLPQIDLAPPPSSKRPADEALIQDEALARTAQPDPSTHSQTQPDPSAARSPPPDPAAGVPKPDKVIPIVTLVVPKTNTGKAECSSHEDPTPTGLPQIDLAPPPSSKRPADEALIQDEALARTAQPDPSTHSQTQPDPSAARSPPPDPAAGVPKRPRNDPTPTLPPPILPRVLPPIGIRPRWIIEKKVPTPNSNPSPNPLDLIDLSDLADLPRCPNNNTPPTEPLCTSNDHNCGDINSNLPHQSSPKIDGPICTPNPLQECGALNFSDLAELPRCPNNNTPPTELLCTLNDHKSGDINSNLPPAQSSPKIDVPLSTQNSECVLINLSDPAEPPRCPNNNTLPTEPLSTENEYNIGEFNPNLPPQSSTKTGEPPFTRNDKPYGGLLVDSTELPVQGSIIKAEDLHDCPPFLAESSVSGDVAPLQECVLIDLSEPEELPWCTNTNITPPTDPSLPSVCTDTKMADVAIPGILAVTQSITPAFAGEATDSNHKQNANSNTTSSDLVMHHSDSHATVPSLPATLSPLSHSGVNSLDAYSSVAAGEDVAQELPANSERVSDATKSLTPAFTSITPASAEKANGSNHQQNDDSNTTRDHLADRHTIAPSLPASLSQPLPSADQPLPSGDQPLPSADQPLPSADQPLPSADQPLPSADQPLPSADQPLPSADQPLPSADQPLPSADQPLPSADQPLPSADILNRDVSVPASRVGKRGKTSSDRSPSVDDFDRSRKRSKFVDTRKTTSDPRVIKPKKARLVIITSSDEEDEVPNFCPVIANPDRQPERPAPLSRPDPPSRSDLADKDVPSFNPAASPPSELVPRSGPVSQSDPVPQPNSVFQPDPILQPDPVLPQPDPVSQPDPVPQPNAENQSDPRNQSESAPQPSLPIPPKYPQRQWSATPHKMTIANIKSVLVAFKYTWRYTDKKNEFVEHYKTLAKKQQEIWRVYLKATSKSKEPTAVALPAPSVSPNGRQPEKELPESNQADEFPVNVPVTRSKTTNRNGGATGPRSTGSVELLGRPDPHDADSIAAVAEIPDLIGMSPRTHTEHLNQPTQPPSNHQQRTDTWLETPLQTRRLVEWARRTDDAMHDMDVDETPTHTDTPQNPAVPEAAVMSAVRILLGPLTDIATGVKSINSSLQVTPASLRRRSTATATTSRRASQAVPSVPDAELSSEEDSDVLMDEGDAETAIRLHCAALMGRVRGGPLPAPAPEAERKQWINPVEDQGDANASDTDSEVGDADNHNVTQEDGMDLDLLPKIIPYHPNVTREALQIMRRQLRLARVRSFRPDLGAAFSTRCNSFLWGLALKTFMIIVRAGEYPTVTASICNEAQAQKHIRTHVDTLMKLWRKQTVMTPAAIAATDKRVRRTTRRARLCEWRVDTILQNPTLGQLLPIVKTCCSEDETDDEIDDEERESLNPRQKACVVLRMPWRHPRVTRMMDELDRIRHERLAANPCSSDPPTRQRKRLPSARQSEIAHPERLPVGAYCPRWMQTLDGLAAETLKPETGPMLNPFIEVLKIL
ncbi:hypothetical protein PGT21_004002 [Puccinia graminis f. sp. tritici]|uniref:Uncharacterized protein n=1 Tax=Puccinia graminis f. sp. tritici TaxID=56615 RepID=A0A5B0MJC1_PUCGR|nr:hypothetical protein PGT21_004002 [Puccinia graminis f. sp. tritici]